MRAALFLLLFIGSLPGADSSGLASPGTGAPPAASPTDTARELIQKAGGLLSSNLLAAIARGGPSNALEFCSLHALNLTRSVGTNPAITLRRVSHKARNPANRADADELAVLKDFQARLQPGVVPAPRWVTHANGRTSYFAPIVLNQPVCLNCHGRPGDQIQPSTQEILRRLYPTDQAVGFQLGDLRGMWRVDVGPSPPPGRP